MNPSFSPEPPETPEPEGLSFAGTMRRGSFELEAAFTCAPGEVLGVLGPNGSGKTSVMRTLAEPTLTAVSGEKATFRVGGEFNLITGQSIAEETNSVTYETERLEYGIGLEFQPTVLSPGRISAAGQFPVKCGASGAPVSRRNPPPRPRPGRVHPPRCSRAAAHRPCCRAAAAARPGRAQSP